MNSKNLKTIAGFRHTQEASRFASAIRFRATGFQDDAPRAFSPLVGVAPALD